MKQLITNLTVAVCFLLASMSVFAQCDGEYIPGFIYMGAHDGSHYYCSSSTNYTWENAKLSAEANGGYLAVINDADENEFVRNGMMANSAWIGYSDKNLEDTFEWFGDASTYENWAAGEPNNYGGNEDYTRIRKYSGEWTDRSEWHQFEFVMEVPCGEDPVDPPTDPLVCTVTCPGFDSLFVACDSIVLDTNIIVDVFDPTDTILMFVYGSVITDLAEPTIECTGDGETGGGEPVCTDTDIPGFIHIGEFNGSNYYCSDNNYYTWQEGYDLSIANGGHLVVINNAEENEYIRNAIMASSAWIGYTDEAFEGNWAWVNGDAATYENWQSGQPNNLYGQEHYARIKKYSGEWTDRVNDIYYEFVMEVPCEVTPPTGGSGEGELTQLTDYAVGDTILAGTNDEVIWQYISPAGDTTICSYILSAASCGGEQGMRVANESKGDCNGTGLCYIKATPNPAIDLVQVSYVSEYTMESSITLYSQIGEALTTIRTTAEKGVNFETIDLSDLPSGLYYVNVQMRGNEQSIKLFKSK